MENGANRQILVATIGSIDTLREQAIVRYEYAGVPRTNRAAVERFDFESEESWNCLAKLPDGTGRFYWGLDDPGFVATEFRAHSHHRPRVWLPLHPVYCWIRNGIEKCWQRNRHLDFLEALREERAYQEPKRWNAILTFEKRLASLRPFFAGEVGLCWELALEDIALYRRALGETLASDDNASMSSFRDRWERARPWDDLIFPFHYLQEMRCGGGTTRGSILRHKGRLALSQRMPR